MQSPMGEPADDQGAGKSDGSIVYVEKRSLSEGEGRELSQQKDVRVAARSMPCSLIVPMSGRGPAPARPSGQQYALAEIGADKSPYSGAGVTVAVLDTGISRKWQDQTAFKSAEIIENDFVNDGAPHDVSGHGTHCVGLIAGRDIDGLRIGVARGVSRILVGKILGRDGGETKRIVDGINWAMANGADVISLSLAIEFDLFIENLISRDKLDRRVATSIALEAYRENIRLFDDLSGVALQKGAVLVAAVGNQSDRPTRMISALLPSTGEGFVPVAATAKTDGGPTRLAYFSNSGAKLAAPGEDIWSAGLDGKAAAMSGTSMAAPLVAGVACLWYEKLRGQAAASGGGVSAEQVVRRMFRASRELTPSISETDVEWGLVQAPGS
jgi:subtilisin family serine protease